MSTNNDQSNKGDSNARDERLWGMLSHLMALAGIVVPPIGFVLGPLIVWLIKKDQYPFVNEQGKESVNFQISMLIYGAVLALLSLTVILAVLTIPLLGALVVFDIVEVVLAAVKANEGVSYKYPLTIRLIS